MAGFREERLPKSSQCPPLVCVFQLLSVHRINNFKQFFCDCIHQRSSGNGCAAANLRFVQVTQPHKRSASKYIYPQRWGGLALLLDHVDASSRVKILICGTVSLPIAEPSAHKSYKCHGIRLQDVRPMMRHRTNASCLAAMQSDNNKA